MLSLYEMLDFIFYVFVKIKLINQYLQHVICCFFQGTFPTLTFVIGLGVSTVVISGLLWVTQRRKAKKQM